LGINRNIDSIIKEKKKKTAPVEFFFFFLNLIYLFQRRPQLKNQEKGELPKVSTRKRFNKRTDKVDKMRGLESTNTEAVRRQNNGVTVSVKSNMQNWLTQQKQR